MFFGAAKTHNGIPLRAARRLSDADMADRPVIGSMLIDAAMAFVMPALTIMIGAAAATIDDAGVVEARIASFAVGTVALIVGIVVAGIGARAVASGATKARR